MSVRARSLHALNRLAYGPRPGDVERLASGGEKAIQEWIDDQLHPERISDEAAQNKLAWFPSLTMPAEQLSRQYHFLPAASAVGNLVPKDADLNDPKVREQYRDIDLKTMMAELQAKRLVLAVESKRQLTELLLEFWWNHFNVDIAKAVYSSHSFERDAIRPNLFGKFRSLLKASANHAAMMNYLDNVSNRAGAPNENYARELMELHTVGVDGGYTQKDVVELSRIMSGWSQDEQTWTFAFHAGSHDSGTKTWLGHRFEGAGKEEGDRVLELLTHHPATSRFIALKLARFFVSDTPPKALVARLAKRFTETDGNLTEVYSALFRSQEFWNSQGAKTKRPFQFVVSAIRGLGGELNESLKEDHRILYLLDEMGEAIFRCPRPTGYDESPKVWMSAGGMVHRMNFASRLARGNFPVVTLPFEASASCPLPELRRTQALALATPEFQKR